MREQIVLKLSRKPDANYGCLTDQKKLRFRKLVVTSVRICFSDIASHKVIAVDTRV